MDESAIVTARALYRCPGHDYEIDRSAHLARLAEFYPPCRECAHRRDVTELSASKRRDWAELERRAQAQPVFTAEGLEALSANEFTPHSVARLAMSLAITVANTSPASANRTVVVGANGHWQTAELLAAACHAIQRAGCDALEAGAVSSASLVSAARRAQAAALWIGNFTGNQHTLGIKLWGPQGRPWSSPGGLDVVREQFTSGVDRPTRNGGNLARLAADGQYLDPLRPMFHALRPLKLVLETNCEPLAAYLDALVANAGCQVIRMSRQSDMPTGGVCRPSSESAATELGRQVVAAGAHGGLWVSGDGERVRVVDEQGATVDDDALWLTLVRYVCDERPSAMVIVDGTAGVATRERSSQHRTTLVTAANTREAIHGAMETEGALLGRGPSGQYWFAGEPAASDALVAISLLLRILSQSDRPVSEVLADHPAPLR